MPVFNDREITLIMNLTRSIAILGEQVPYLASTIEKIAPTTNHQRQVASLQRQSEAVEKLNFIVSQTKSYATFEGYGPGEKHNGGIKFEESIHKFLARELPELRKILTG